MAQNQGESRDWKMELARKVHPDIAGSILAVIVLIIYFPSILASMPDNLKGQCYWGFIILVASIAVLPTSLYAVTRFREDERILAARRFENYSPEDEDKRIAEEISRAKTTMESGSDE